MQTLAVPDIFHKHSDWLFMKGEKGQVSHFKPMQIDTHLGYDVYNIFINVTSLNEIKAQDKIVFFHIESIKKCSIKKDDRDICSIDGISLREEITKF